MSVRPSMRCARPSTCSGDMNAGVPKRSPSSEPAPASVMASPKSTSTGPRSLVRMTLAGLTSRWTTARSCAWPSASATLATSLGHFAPMRVSAFSTSVEGAPSSRSETMKHSPSSTPTSKTVRMPGWLSLARLRASRRNRSASCGLHLCERDLDGDFALQLRVVAGVDSAEASFAADATHLVAAERQRWHGNGGSCRSCTPRTARLPASRSLVRSVVPGSRVCIGHTAILLPPRTLCSDRGTLHHHRRTDRA